MVKELTLNKVVAAFVGAAIVVSLASALAVSRAHAVTLAELVELFIALEVIPADKADEARTVLSSQDSETPSMDSMSCNFTRNLAVGDSGMDVKDLQKLLNGKGFTVAASGAGSVGMESEYYGQMTAAAVAKMQEAFASEILAPLGLSAGTGSFGPATRAKANALCAAAPVTPPVVDEDDEEEETSNLGGDEGSIDSVDSASADESNLDEGQEGGVLGFDVTIEGDVMINRIDVYAAEDGSASDDAEDYFVRAFLMVDGEEVAELDVEDWDQDDYDYLGLASNDDYRLRFSGLDLAFEDGDEPEFQVGFEVVTNLDSTDLASDWDVALESIRYEDGEGFTDTWEDTSDPLDDAADTFGFDAEETAELSITEDSTSPDASTIMVDDSEETEDVTVFVFSIEEENGVDVTVDDLTVTVDVGTANEDVVVASASLWNGSEELDSVNVPNLGVVEFENLGLEIAGDDEVTLTVKLTFEDTNDGVAYTNGETVSVAFTSIDTAEDANGNDEGDMNISGTPSGEEHQLLAEGVYAEIKTDESDLINEDVAGADKAEYVLEFEVTAFEDDFYIPFGAGLTVTTEGVLFRVETDAGVVATTTGTTTDGLSNTSGADTDGNFWIVQDGETETFELTVTYNPATNGTYRAQLDAVFYATSTTASLQRHNAAPEDDFETGTVQVTDN